MKREISKRIELSKEEAKILQMKADQCRLTESDLIREMIMGCQPVEAPPRQFYERMEIMNQLEAEIQQFLLTWMGVTSPEMVQILQGMYNRLCEACIEIKESVTRVRFYSPDVYEIWEYEAQKAAKEGNTPPTLDEVREWYTRKAIMNPATDYDLGWNALGVQPPFLGEGEAYQGDSQVVYPGEAPAAYPNDSSAGYPGIYPAPYPNGSTFTGQDVTVDGGYERTSDSDKWQMADGVDPSGIPETQAEYTHEGSISIEDYATTNILTPPRKEGGV
jgi:hypothetical protein